MPNEPRETGETTNPGMKRPNETSETEQRQRSRSRSVLERARQVLKEVKYGKETATDIEEKVEHNETQVKEKPPLTKELLHEDYVVRRLSTLEMAKKTGWSPGTVFRHLRKEGLRIRSREEAQRLWYQREEERARRCVDPSIPKILKGLDIEYTKHGRIKIRNLPPEVRKTLKDEALRLREIGGWGYKIVSRALGPPEDTVRRWFLSSPKAYRERALRWYHKHKEEVLKRRHRREKEAKEALIRRFGGRCEKDGVSDHRLFVFHEFEKDPKYRGKGFWHSPWGKLWIRSHGTEHEDEAFEKIWKKAILLCKECHDKKVTAKERRLGRSPSREEILSY